MTAKMVIDIRLLRRSALVTLTFTIIFVTTVGSGQPKKKSFMPVLTIPDANWTCAVEDPSKVISLTGVGDFLDVAQCAMKCTGDVDCAGFNMKNNSTRLCEMYAYTPTRFALVPGCQYRQIYPLPPENTSAENVLRVADASFVSSCQQYTVTHYYNCDSNIGNYTAIVNDRIWLTCPNYIGCHEEAEQTAAVDPGQTSPNNSTCWILIQQNDGFNGQFFNRTWHSYRDGFGDASGNYWIGNQHLHQMTQLDNQACRLRVEVEIKASGEWLWAEYDSMSVESENDNYVLHVYGYQGNAGDAFNDDHEQVWQSNGMQFSTWDVDNDQLPGRNCAYDYGSGWWFRACSSSNLNTKKKRRWYSTGAYWYSKIRISASRMMLQCGTA